MGERRGGCVGCGACIQRTAADEMRVHVHAHDNGHERLINALTRYVEHVAGDEI